MLKPISQEQLISFLVEDEKLFSLGLDYVAQEALKSGDYQLKEPNYIVGYFEEGNLCSVIQLELLNTATVIIHWYCASKYWGTGLTARCVAEVEEFIKNNSAFLSAMIYVPVCCTPVLACVERAGFQRTGTIPCGILWREGEAFDLALMHKLLIREGSST